MSLLRKALGIPVILVLALAMTWAAAALYVDFPVPWLRIPLAVIFLTMVAAVVFTVRRGVIAVGLCVVLFCGVLGWWLTLKPSNDRPWLRDVARTPWADVQGDKVTIHNLRNFDYVTEMDYTPHWETRTVDVSKIRGADFYMNYWGSPAIAHTIVSFEFSDSLPVAISLSRREKVEGQSYSADPGFLPSVLADLHNCG